MKAILFEKYYKRGLNHYFFKNVLGLHKPDKAVKRFYYILIALMVLIGNLIILI